ncbi:MAG: transcriptional repressor, partial [Bryobacteraceae bacterium]|nr:transcriptional repressor [Bryobacteraceae bacterium]
MTRSTRQRRAIRAVFERLNRPLSPQEILDQVAGEVDGIGIATVYRTIKSFVEEAIITPVDVPGEPARYELSGKGHH